MEWVNSDSGRELAANAQTIQQNARKLRLLTKDGVLTEPLRAAQNLMKDTTHWDAIHGRGPRTDEARGLAFRHINATKSAFGGFEASAVELLSRQSPGPGDELD